MLEVMGMERKPVYRRVLLKISGEALAGEKKTGLDFGVIGEVCEAVKRCVDMGVEVGVVIGGGNFWRGVKDGEGKIERTRADHMGMLATVMNCLAVADVMEQHGARRPRGAEQQEIVNYRVQRKEAVKVNRLHGQIIHRRLCGYCHLQALSECGKILRDWALRRIFTNSPF